jgi:GNAT superfamily N-acetyltransferase
MRCVRIVIRKLPSDGLTRFAEIDRSEEIHVHYRQLEGELTEEIVAESVPDFFREGEHHSIAELVKTWQPVVDAGGVLLGAFDEDRLAGMALLGTELAPGVAQVALLFVSRPFRRRRVASALMDEMEHLAQDFGARSLYVSAVPSESAVRFYLSRGFRPTEPFPEQFAKEPEDIHMLLPLSPPNTDLLDERIEEVDSILRSIETYASGQEDVEAVGLVGSWARGNARLDSDVDLILITTTPSRYLTGTEWMSRFPGARLIRTMAWGDVLTERRFLLPSGLEVEVGITDARWASTDPVDEGTAEVVTDALRIIYDPEGLLARLAAETR